LDLWASVKATRGQFSPQGLDVQENVAITRTSSKGSGLSKEEKRDSKMDFVLGMDATSLGLLASLGAGLATGLGAILVFFLRNVPVKIMDGLLGFSAGIMLGARSFNLVLPSIKLGRLWVTSLGMILGGLFLAVANRLTPHLHFLSGREGISLHFSRVWLFVLAITIHNFPEGMSVGVGFGRGEVTEGMALAMGIGFQNMPEGLASPSL
jgi:ZIP family zinc transporter